MRIEDLNDEELKVFLNGQPVEILRDMYSNIDSLRDQLKGFRPNKAPQSVLVNTSFALIRRKKSDKLSAILTKNYNRYVKEMYERVKEYEEHGYSHYSALASLIFDSFNPNFRKVFYKLEEYPEEEIRTIEDLINLLCIARQEATRIIDKKIDGSNQNETIEELKNQINDVSDNVEDINELIDSQKETSNTLDKKIDSVKKELLEAIQDKATKDQLTKMVDSSIENLRNDLKDFSKNDEIISLRKEIEELKETIKSVPQIKQSELCEYDFVEASEYSEMEDCEYLNEDISDAVENLVENDSIDVLREYVVETIFGYKPIITTTKNIDIVADVYASVMTGGEYYSISIDDNYSFSKLKATIEEITNGKENAVVVIKNFMNSYDYRSLHSYLIKQPFTHKFILDIHYQEEIKFMPTEIIEDFYFLLGEFNNKQIEYRFTHVFSERTPIINSTYEKTLSQIGIDMSDKHLFNVKFYGLLSYSVIPFLSISSGTEKVELINQILDAPTRKKCEALIND